jgi:flagellar hook-associated protein 1 FlgK
VRDVQVQRSANQLLESRLNTQRSHSRYAQSRADGLAQMVSAVGNFDEVGVNAALTDMFNSWRQLTAQPQDLSVRAEVLTRGQMFAERVNDAANHLTASAKLADDSILNALSTVNDNLSQVANLNGLITAAMTSGQVPSALMDQRDELVGDLAVLTGATSYQQTNGDISLVLGGVSVVSGKSAYALEASRDPVTGYHHLTVANTTQGVMDSRITGGELGAQLALRDADIGGAQAQLDQFAVDVATAFNTVHAAGYGLDGVTGRNFFTPPAAVTGAAGLLALDSSATPSALAAASTATTISGGNDQALAITALESSLVAAGNTQTLGSSVTQLISYSGRLLSDAQADGNQAYAFLTQTQSLWEQQNGVSLDEQMMQLSRIQNAYQAAAKLITTVNGMLEVLQRL